jgi:hypothetical protein
MSCEYTDSIHMEVLGQMTAFKQALIDHMSMEVLGFFKWGSVDVDHLTMEVLGNLPSFAIMDHMTMEVLGQWDGCPTCH